MADDPLLRPGLPSTPERGAASGSLSLGDLPDDLLRESSHRLQIATLVWATLWSVALLFNNLVSPLLDLPADRVIGWGTPGNVIGVGCLLLSLGLFGYSRRPECDPRRLLDLGLAHEVVLAFGIGVLNQWVPQVLAGRLSWICVLILVYPMIAPSTPWKTFSAAMLAASMDPVGLLLARARGLELPGPTLLIWAYLPNYVCAGLAIVPSHIMLRLGRQVTRARELGSYRLAELIGRGGMGEVWRAEHRLLARPAAIKLIRREMLGLGDSETVHVMTTRFRREAEAAASLRCPHTIQLYDFGVTHDQTFYLVMELLDGIDLETLVQRFGPVPPARAVHLLRQACRSLAEAHARGLIHRDIKPANLHLCQIGLEYDFVKVLDFGLVKHDPQLAARETKLTAPELTTGTPAYMAPEMAGGDPLDRRTDLYSLGCVGYWLLTGRLVFPADTALKMVVRHLQERPVPPSQCTDPPIPASLDAVILACLEKSPVDRPDSADELAARLAACDVGAPWSQALAGEWWERNLGGSARPTATDPGPISPTVRSAATIHGH
jgi:serine/threonine-protein kinase